MFSLLCLWMLMGCAFVVLVAADPWLGQSPAQDAEDEEHIACLREWNAGQ